jgi:predicted esterase
MLCFALAVHFPGSEGMVIPISGALPVSLHKTEKAPGSYPKLLVLHGAADTIVPFEYGQATARMTAALGIETTFKAYPSVEHTISSAMRRDLIAAVTFYVAKQ